jgi:threonyl-tRNA synthetase
LSYRLELSTRPDKSIGTDEDWEIATRGLKEALEDWGQEYRINEGDGSFYGPKIDIHIRDAIGRSWQCGTIQLDMSLPEKFALEYVDSDGLHKRPVMRHRALFGSIERFFGILIEHFSGKFPFWLSPYQIRILPVADRHIPYAQLVANRFREQGLVVDVDDSHESISKKVRTAQLLKTNYMLTVGDKEVEHETISLRTRDNIVHGEVDISNFLAKVMKERDTRALD